MRFQLPWLLATSCLLTSFASGQTSDQNLPSAPSATVQESAPEKQPPATDSKPVAPAPAPARPQKPVQELKLGETLPEKVPPQTESAKPATPPATTPTIVAVPAQTVPASGP